MKVIGYVRVSTAEQEKNGLSLETQRRQIEGWAAVKGWDVSKVYVESGVSGSVPLYDRPEGKRLVDSLSPGDVIITSKLDRLFRSAADALGTLEAIKAQGVALHMIDLGGDVTGNGISKMVFTILAAVAEGERDRIRERIFDAKRDRAARGIFNGGLRTFGYDIDGEGKERRLVPNAHEQRVLARGRALRAKGKTYRDVADAWAAEFGMKKDPKTIQRMLSRKAETSPAPRAGKKIARTPRVK
jgi:DNA invertase Pin-like site-specific DNA recombinase